MATLEELEQGVEDGYFEVECPTCGEYHTLEPDEKCECDCGTTVQSPLVTMGII